VRNIRTIVLLVVLGLMILVVAWVFLPGRHDPTAQELTEAALHGGTPDAQEQAAVRLEALASKTPRTGTRNPIQPLLCRLLNESDNPGVRAAGMRGLAAIWDYECVPKMFELLTDPSPQVCGTAARSLGRLISAEVKFDANAPTEDKAKKVERIREQWTDFDKKFRVRWQRRLEEKDSKL